ncbi:uncharacterized protein LOC113318686 [Papaver somniferum]|uniref:uncharacterized protein LOC113318686 n=1 Tax=Papaver somniferum TaxID=3469 RepID=UPI000E6FF640|nr:uncharacterized protein LOC113318686 [Papaver somniferum]
MTSLSNLGIGLSLVFSLLLLALIAELYYLLWWKKKKRAIINDIQDDYSSSSSSAREFLYLFCWKKPSSLSSTGLFTDPEQENNQLHLHSSSSKLSSFGEDSIEAELMRLHNLSGPPRLLFTIKEETKEDLESEDGRSRNNNNKVSRRSLADLLLVAVETPFLTPMASPRLTPPLTPIHYNQNAGTNPLFESSVDPEMCKIIRPSPSPTFKFLKDAEDKFSRKRLIEEALKRVQKNAAVSPNEEDGCFTVTVDKHKEESEFDHYNHQNALPLSSSPSPSTVKSCEH